MNSPKSIAILLKILDADPLAVEKLSRDNLFEIIREDYYDGSKLSLTPRGRAFVAKHLAPTEKTMSNPCGGRKRKKPSFRKNPSDQLHQVSWLKSPVTEENFDEIAAYYKGFRPAKIRWFDEKSGEGFVRLDDGPLKDFSVFVHGSAFGGDQNFGQNTDFEPKEKLPVQVKLWVDWDNLMVTDMKENK